MTMEKNPSTASPKLTSMTFPRKIHFSLLVFYTLSRGKKIQTVPTPPLQLVFFSLNPVVGKKKEQDFNNKLALWMNKTDQTFKSAPKNDSTDPIDIPNKTPLLNSTRTFFFPHQSIHTMTRSSQKARYKTTTPNDFRSRDSIWAANHPLACKMTSTGHVGECSLQGEGRVGKDYWVREPVFFLVQNPS